MLLKHLPQLLKHITADLCLRMFTDFGKEFKAKRQDVDEMSDAEITASIKDAFASIDKKAIFKEAKDLFTSMRKDGSLNEVGKDIDISDDDEWFGL